MKFFSVHCVPLTTSSVTASIQLNGQFFFVPSSSVSSSQKSPSPSSCWSSYPVSSPFYPQTLTLTRTISVSVVVTKISEPILVLVLLSRVLNRGTVVADVADHVSLVLPTAPVRVLLSGVRRKRTVVLERDEQSLKKYVNVNGFANGLLSTKTIDLTIVVYSQWQRPDKYQELCNRCQL